MDTEMLNAVTYDSVYLIKAPATWPARPSTAR